MLHSEDSLLIWQDIMSHFHVTITSYNIPILQLTIILNRWFFHWGEKYIYRYFIEKLCFATFANDLIMSLDGHLTASKYTFAHLLQVWLICTPSSRSCRLKTRKLHCHSLSLLSRKFWILLKFSSCWPSAASRMPMGDFFSPALSILFSSLFFMLRRRREAWAKITGM